MFKYRKQLVQKKQRCASYFALFIIYLKCSPYCYNYAMLTIFSIWHLPIKILAGKNSQSCEYILCTSIFAVYDLNTKEMRYNLINQLFSPKIMGSVKNQQMPNKKSFGEILWILHTCRLRFKENRWFASFLYNEKVDNM